jgi:hypothetical protein
VIRALDADLAEAERVTRNVSCSSMSRMDMVAPKKPRIATSAENLDVVQGRRPSPGVLHTSSSSPAGCVTRIERAPKRSWMPVWQTR